MKANRVRHIGPYLRARGAGSLALRDQVVGLLLEEEAADPWKRAKRGRVKLTTVADELIRMGK